MRKEKILFRIIFSIFFILLAGILSGICSSAADIEEEAEYSEKIEESVMRNFDFQEIDKVMEDLFPEEKLHFKDMVLAFEKGEIEDALDVVKRLVKDRMTYAFRINKEIWCKSFCLPLPQQCLPISPVYFRINRYQRLVFTCCIFF